jgi:menaquinone-dependent protoporphyrinogen oxidase
VSDVLVVYGTKTGATAGIAEQIGETLSDAGATVQVAPAGKAPPATGFDAVVVGSGVRAGNWHGAAKEWVRANADGLAAVPTAFFTVGLTMGVEPEKADEVRAYTDPLIEETGVKPLDVGLFAGMNEPKRFSLPERLIIKAMKAPEGDFRDLDAVARWARGVAGDLSVA